MLLPTAIVAPLTNLSTFGTGIADCILDDELPSLDEASSSVDALVADDDPLDMAFFQTRSSSAQLTLRQAPAPPPGLGIAPQAAPVQPPVAVPVVPASPARIQTPSVPKVQTMAGIVRAATPDQPAKKKVPGSEAKKSIKALAVESGLSKDIASHQQSPSTKSKKLLQEEDFPALDSIKTGVSRVGTPALSTMSTPKGSPMVKKARVEAPKESTPVAAEKKAAPITLNIAAAVKAAAKTPSDTPAASATEKPDSAAFPALPTPAAVVASPSVKAAPKTLRVVNTPKVETPPVLAAAHLVNAATRAVSGISRPDTPASHDISDSASIVSTAISASRSSSPPPGPSRIGSAPVRSTTKSQQRKARKDATKEQSAALSETRVVEPEEHAPILGRQKKKKREKPTPVPVAKPVEKAAPKKAESKIDVTSPAPAEAKTKSAPSPSKKSSQKEQKKPEPPKAQPKAAQVVAPKTAPATTPSPTAAAVTLPEATEPQEPADNPKTMPDVVFSDLVRSGMTANHDYLAIFKTFNEQQQQGGGGSHNRVGHIFTTSSEPFNPPPSTKNIVSEQDHATLLSGMPVHKIVDSHRVLITPNGDCLRNLSEEEEQKYLFYQKRVARAADQPDSFVAPRHQPRAGGFSLVKGRAVPNGPPSFFPPNPAASQRLFSDDPVNKLQREEAISYINQFVLPRLNLGTANLGFPGGFKSAPGAANPGAAGKDGPGAPTHRDVAAAQPELARAVDLRARRCGGCRYLLG